MDIPLRAEGGFGLNRLNYLVYGVLIWNYCSPCDFFVFWICWFQGDEFWD